MHESVHDFAVKHDHVPVLPDGRSVAAQAAPLRAAGCNRVFRETAWRAKTDRAQLYKALYRAETWREVTRSYSTISRLAA
jgi:hypothetical protein